MSRRRVVIFFFFSIIATLRSVGHRQNNRASNKLRLHFKFFYDVVLPRGNIFIFAKSAFCADWLLRMWRLQSQQLCAAFFLQLRPIGQFYRVLEFSSGTEHVVDTFLCFLKDEFPLLRKYSEGNIYSLMEAVARVRFQLSEKLNLLKNVQILAM